MTGGKQSPGCQGSGKEDANGGRADRKPLGRGLHYQLRARANLRPGRPPPRVSTADEYSGRSPCASAGTLLISWRGGHRPVSQFSWTSGGRCCPLFPAFAVRCLEDTYMGSLRGGHRPEGLRAIELVLFTEYTQIGKLFRSHPSYRGDLPWHDWAMFRYKLNEQDTVRRKTFRDFGGRLNSAGSGLSFPKK
jgi:hypothetical protein